MAEDYKYIAQRRQQEIADQQKSNASWIMPWAAGIGAIAVGAFIFKKKIATDGGIAANFLHYLGHPTSINTNVDKIANSGASQAASGASGIKSILSGKFNIVKNQLQLGPIDLIKDVGAGADILGATDAGTVRERLSSLMTEFIHRKHVNYGNNTSFFGDDLQRVTVGEVLDNQEKWTELIGSNQWRALSSGVSEGIIGRSAALDRNIYKTKQGFVKDLRVRNIFMKSVQDINYDYGLVPKFDFFGQFNVFKSLFGESQGIAALGASKPGAGPRFFIGGNIFEYAAEGGAIRETISASGKKLRRVGDKLEPITAAREGRLTLELKERTSFVGKLVTKFEETTGVGTSFSSRKSFFSTFIVDPIKRLKGLATGEAAIVKTHTNKGDYIATLADQVYGAEIPELVERSERSGLVTGINVDFKDLSFTEKLLTIFDKSPQHALINRGATARIDSRFMRGEATYLRPDEMYTAAAGTGGYKIQRTLPHKAYRVSGGKSVENPKFYVSDESKLIPGMTSIRDFISYLSFRTSHLASATLFGISYAPAKTAVGNMARLAAIPIIYGAGLETINYADYMMESITGVSPKKALASGYTSLRLMQQKIRGITGIQQGLDSMEKNYPGSVDSGLGFFARSLAAPALAFTQLAKRTSIGKAIGGAAAVFGLVGGQTPGQSYEDLQAEYSGEKKVAVRKGRFWFMGNQPLEGGEISRYDYSWYHKLMSDYQYKSVYGDKSEYYKYHSNVYGIPFPTLQNFGGIRNLLNPYRIEDINKGSRPYEVTSNMFEEVPVFGPILASTIGKIVKPRIERRPEEYLSRQGVVPGGLDPQTARDLGIPDLNATAPEYDNLLSRVQKMANVATEPLGVYKFALEFFGVKFNPSIQERAESSLMDSDGRRFYGAQLGGLLGQSEFLRRFMLSDYGITANTAAMINRTANTSPDWMPGTRSKFQRDQSYFIDFSAGDPFLKVEDAESRLPGQGYESLNRLHSGKAGVYDEVDRLLILADVAPFSQAFKTYQSMVGGMKLDPYWQSKVDKAMEYKTGMTSIENRYPRHIDSLININESLASSPIYNVTRGLYDTVTHDFLAEIPWIGNKLAPFRDPYEKYRKSFVEGSEFGSWFNPYEDIVRPTLYDAALSNPLIAAVKGAGTVAMMSGPLRFMNPIANLTTSLRSPVNLPAIAAGAVGGASMSLGRIAAGLPSNYVPEHTQDESDAIQYADHLTYYKHRSLEMFAESKGLGSQAEQFRKMQRKTMVGANSPLGVRSSLPRSTDKKYFDVFLNTPEDKRQELTDGLPQYMSYALNKVWTSDFGGQNQADQEVLSMMDVRGIPTSDWQGWHPSVDDKSMKLKIVDHGLNGISDNYHRYGFYESHERTLRQNYPDLWNQSTTFTAPPIYASASESFRQAAQHISEGFGSSTVHSTPFGARFMNRIQRDDTSQMRESYRRELRQ